MARKRRNKIISAARETSMMELRCSKAEHDWVKRAIGQARRDLVRTTKRAPQRTEAQNLAARFRNHEDAYFEFLTTPGVEPTNNWAEQDIRHVVIDRKITQGTRGLAGRRWCERIWSTIASCAQQQKAVFPVLEEVIRAHFSNEAGPSLLPCAPP